MERNNRSYYKTNRITSWIKHVDVNHVVITKMFEEEINIVVKGVLKTQPTKKIKKFKVSNNVIQKNKSVQNSFPKWMMCNKNNLCKTLSFWLSKITYYSICA
jgi:hypothetical protein